MWQFVEVRQLRAVFQTAGSFIKAHRDECLCFALEGFQPKGGPGSRSSHRHVTEK